MSNEKIPCKIYLSENEFPDSWYNVRADMKNRLRRLRVSENIRSLVHETSKPIKTLSQRLLSVALCHFLGTC